MLKGLMLYDALIVLLVFGKNVKIPGVGLNLTEIPAALEVVTFAASLSFLFLAVAFLNHNLYGLVADAISRKRLGAEAIDSDFITGADKRVDFYLKILRQKFYIYGIDYFAPGRGFKIMGRIIMLIIFACVVSMLLVHFGCIILSVKQSIANGIGWLEICYLSFVAVAHLGGLLLFFMPYVSFEFSITPHAAASSPIQPPQMQSGIAEKS